VRACVRACMRACVRACVRACMRACAFVRRVAHVLMCGRITSAGTGAYHCSACAHCSCALVGGRAAHAVLDHPLTHMNNAHTLNNGTHRCPHWLCVHTSRRARLDCMRSTQRVMRRPSPRCACCSVWHAV